VVMLTTSSSEKDIARSYKNHVNSYITKPINISEFWETISAIEHFWLKTSKFPPK
jgi:DNA-binding response OmpR family regulator